MSKLSENKTWTSWNIYIYIHTTGGGHISKEERTSKTAKWKIWNQMTSHETPNCTNLKSTVFFSTRSRSCYCLHTKHQTARIWKAQDSKLLLATFCCQFKPSLYFFAMGQSPMGQQIKKAAFQRHNWVSACFDESCQMKPRLLELPQKNCLGIPMVSQ